MLPSKGALPSPRWRPSALRRALYGTERGIGRGTRMTWPTWLSPPPTSARRPQSAQGPQPNAAGRAGHGDGGVSKPRELKRRVAPQLRGRDAPTKQMDAPNSVASTVGTSRDRSGPGRPLPIATAADLSSFSHLGVLHTRSSIPHPSPSAGEGASHALSCLYTPPVCSCAGRAFAVRPAQSDLTPTDRPPLTTSTVCQ